MNMLVYLSFPLLIMLALLNAVFGHPPHDWTHRPDGALLPTFMKSEGLARAFAINLCFAAVSTAALGVNNNVQNRSEVAMLTLVAGLLLAVLAGTSLKQSAAEIQSIKRVAWAASLCVLGCGLLAIAVVVTTGALAQKPQLPVIAVEQQ